MRVNIYEQEQTHRIMLQEKTVNEGVKYYGLHFYLYSSERLNKALWGEGASAVVFWSKDPEELRSLFSKALEAIDEGSMTSTIDNAQKDDEYARL